MYNVGLDVDAILQMSAQMRTLPWTFGMNMNIRHNLGQYADSITGANGSHSHETSS